VGQELLNFLTTAGGTDRLSRDVDKELPRNADEIPKKREFFKKVNQAKTETCVSSGVISNNIKIYQKHLAS